MNIGVVFGGMSAEHEVSWSSARNVIKALAPQERYVPVPIMIDRDGGWHLVTAEVLDNEDPLLLPGSGIPPEARGVILDPEEGRLSFRLKADGSRAVAVEALFPMVHGPYGEDGTLQGLCKLFRIPFVGPGVLASAACMDKEVMKRILLDNGPQGGDLRDVKVLDTLVASADPVAADAFATTLFGLQPKDIDSTVAAHALGLGEMNLAKMKIVTV